jgi:hypothetical protein
VRGTRTYAVECYSTDVDRSGVERLAARAREVAAALRNRGDSVDYLGALLVPGDEVVFYLFESPSAKAVREASSEAGIVFERVLESIAIGFAGSCGGVPDAPQEESAA